MVNLTAKQLYDKLVNEYGIIGQKGKISFQLKDITAIIDTRDTVGNLIQIWLKEWLHKNNIYFNEPGTTQDFPDFHLDTDPKADLLELKTFDYDRSANFDIANFETYCKSLLTNSYRIDADYLIIGYSMEGTEICIKNVWLKKVWEISGPSEKWDIKVQDKRNMIYNIRPVKWYSNERTTFKPFNDKLQFLKGIHETLLKYPKTRYESAHWLNKVLKNYKHHTGINLNK